jgi:hypothetical protein
MELLILLAPMIVWFVVLLVRNKDLPKSVETKNEVKDSDIFLGECGLDIGVYYKDKN